MADLYIAFCTNRAARKLAYSAFWIRIGGSGLVTHTALRESVVALDATPDGAEPPLRIQSRFRPG